MSNTGFAIQSMQMIGRKKRAGVGAGALESIRQRRRPRPWRQGHALASASAFAASAAGAASVATVAGFPAFFAFLRDLE